MNRPEVDLSELHLRENVEDKIENIILKQGFRKVDTKSGDEKTTIAWKRSLRLYEFEKVDEVNG